MGAAMLRTRAAVICLGILAGAFATMAETATEDIDGRRQALEPYFHTYRPNGPRDSVCFRLRRIRVSGLRTILCRYGRGLARQRLRRGFRRLA